MDFTVQILPYEMFFEIHLSAMAKKGREKRGPNVIIYFSKGLPTNER